MAHNWTLEDLYRGIMQSWFVLAGTVIVFVLAGTAIFAVYPQKYTAEAQQTVEPISVLTSGSSFNTVNMETERVVATSTAVLARAIESLTSTSVEALRANTTVEVPRNSQVLVFRVTANTPQLAAERANALATAYGEQRIGTARAVVEEATDELETSITQLQDLLTSQPEGSNQRVATQQQLQALLDQQARITATPFYSGSLVTPAEPPQSSNRPSVLVFIAAGLFLGMLLGAIAALLVSRAHNGEGSDYRRRIRAEEAVFDETGSDTAALQTTGSGEPVVLDDDDRLLDSEDGGISLQPRTARRSSVAERR